MITCKICEKEVIEDLLGPHSQKCREVFEVKEELRNIMNSMESHGDKAASMRNSLETYATKQQKKYNKRASSKDLLDVSITGHLKSSNSGLAVMSPAVSRRLNESEFSEDEKMDRTLSTQETVETQDDVGKRMTEEEHLKLLEEVKKSIIVLKKVIDYAKSIADWALDLASVCEVGVHTHTELEAYEKEIMDTNVLQFLQTFIFDIQAYNLLREKYVSASHELMKIGSPKSIGAKPKPPMKKAQSFKNKTEGLVKGAIFGFKPKPEDPGSAVVKKKESPGLEKRKLGSNVTPIQIAPPSPGLEKRKLPGANTPLEVGTASPNLERRKLSHGTLQVETGVASPSLEKRKLSMAVDTGSLSKKTTPRQLPQGTDRPNILTMFASPSLKGMKGDLSKNLLTANVNHISGLFPSSRKNQEEGSIDLGKTLLQTNSNHMASFAGFQTPRRNPEDSASLRDKIKASVNLNFLDSSPRSSEMMSPSSGRRELSSKKVVGKMAINANATLSAFGKAKTEVKTSTEQKPVIKKPSSPVGGSGGMGWFKTIRNEDTAGLSKFSSPVPTRSTNPNSEDEATPTTTVKKSNGMTFLEGSAVNFQKPKPKNEVKEFFESPMMKGYYSDCNASRSKRRISRLESNDVSLEDFEFIKYIGKGAYGTVWLVKKKATGAHYAMKMVEWADRGTQNRMKALKAEKDIYQALEGDFVVKALWTFHYENSICFVTEYMLGGDFCKILDRVARLDEPQAQFYFAELVLAVESLHKLGVVHRDLKPDNILMDEKGHIRLTDFGLSQKGIDRLKGNTTPTRKNTMSPNSHEDALAKARVNMLNKMCKNSPSSSKRIEFKQKTSNLKGSRTMFGFLGKEEEYQRMMEKKPMFNKAHKELPSQGGEKKHRMVGTPDYMAPEIIAPEKYEMEGYDEKNMDWWSMGVILYQLLVGIPPFCDNTVEAVFENIREHRIEFPPIGDDEDCISSNAYSLINQLLNPNFKKRLGAKRGAEEVKEHPFFEGIDWATLREKEAPIIPCSLEEQLNSNEEELKTPNLVKMNSDLSASSPVEGFGITRSKTAKPMQFNGFQMRRLDLLDKANQDTHKELVRQKSGKLQLS